MNDMNETVTVTVTEPKAVKAPTLPDAQIVTEVRHWTDRLFSFRVTRPRSLRFRSGEFVMLGLMMPCCRAKTSGSSPPAPALRPSRACCATRRPITITTR